MNWIAGLMSGAFTGVGKAVKYGYKASKTVPTSALAGAGIGTAVGFATSDAEKFQNRLNDALEGGMKGALFGAGAGLAIKGAKQIFKPGDTWKMLEESYQSGFVRAGINAADFIGNRAFEAGRFAFENPLAIAAVGGGIAAVGAGMASVGQTLISPTMAGVRMDSTLAAQESMAAVELRSNFIMSPAMGRPDEMMGNFQQAQARQDMLNAGIAQNIANERLRRYSDRFNAMTGSNINLVQGLHNGRHG